MTERPTHVVVPVDVFEGLMLAAESLPGGQVWKLLAAAHESVKPWSKTPILDSIPDVEG